MPKRGRPPVANPRDIKINVCFTRDEARALGLLRKGVNRGRVVRDAAMVGVEVKP